MASSLLPGQMSLETMLQYVATRAFHANIAQLPLETTFGTTRIHPTHLVGVRGRAENQMLWCNTHNVQMGVRMGKLATLQLV